MEPNIPTSFIPKRPIESVAQYKPHTSGSVGLLSLLTFVIALGTGISYAGIFLYKKQLVSQKENLEIAIKEQQNIIGTEFLTDMKRLDSRIAGVNDIIKNHIVVTPIFEALETSTLRSIQYKNFGYSVNKLDAADRLSVVNVDLTGIAKNYATIALQSDAFSKNKLIKNPVFSNLTSDDKTKAINFKLNFSVDTENLSYQKFIDSRLKKQKKDTAPSTTPSSEFNPVTP